MTTSTPQGAPFRPGRLQDKVAIITGAASGIGRAMALAYGAEGAKVVCADVRESTKFNSSNDETRGTTQDRVIENGGEAIFVKVDVSSAADVSALVQAAVDKYGRLDIMCNNAGVADMVPSGIPPPIWDVPLEVWERTQAINSTGVFLGIKYAAAQMIKQTPHSSGDRGWIINTASILGVVGAQGTSSYCASKGAVVNLSKAAALDCAPQRIHVNAIGPGYTESSMTSPLFEKAELRQKLLDKHPFRGLGRPEDIARVAVFLASEDAGWVTGVYLPVDGGYLAR